MQLNSYTVGPGQPILIIAGPCAIESYDQCMQIGEAMQSAAADCKQQYVFKASFDKANRSSISSPRGPGLEEGLNILDRVRHSLGVPVTTDIHESSQAVAIGQVVDMIQVPAFLCRQTDLLVASAETGKPVNVKKGQFMSPQEMTNVVNKLEEASAVGIMLTERGTSFGYNRLVNDFVGLGDMMEIGPPVCFDVTHSTQQPGGKGTSSGGRPDRAAMLARCAVVAGVHSLFIECHPDPANALSDAATMLELSAAVKLLGEVQRLHITMGELKA